MLFQCDASFWETAASQRADGSMSETELEQKLRSTALCHAVTEHRDGPAALRNIGVQAVRAICGGSLETVQMVDMGRRAALGSLLRPHHTK